MHFRLTALRGMVAAVSRHHARIRRCLRRIVLVDRPWSRANRKAEQVTGTQAIESQDITVGGIFQAFYAVPDYQREYVWHTAQVEQLLSDILSEMPPKPSEAPPAEYFIGSIVVCPNAAGVLDLIDGQQRMTTLFVTLCAIRDRLEALKR